jgi:hypothetical protein
VACTVFFILSVAFFVTWLTYAELAKSNFTSFLNDFGVPGDYSVPPAFLFLVRLFVGYAVLYYLFAVFLISRGIRQIRKWAETKRTILVNAKALGLQLFSLLMQFLTNIVPFFTILDLLAQNSCEHKVKILKRVPGVYNLYIFAGVLNVLTLLAMCLYLGHKIRQRYY